MTEKEFRVLVLKGLVAILYAVLNNRRHHWFSEIESAVYRAQSSKEGK